MAELQVLLMDGVGRQTGEGRWCPPEMEREWRGVVGEGNKMLEVGSHWSRRAGDEGLASWAGNEPVLVPTFREEVWGQVRRLAIPCNNLGEEKGWERECPAPPSPAWGGGGVQSRGPGCRASPL